LTYLVDNHKVDGVYPDLGLPYLNAAIREVDVVATRAKKFDDDDTQECCHGKFLTTHLTTFVKCAASADGTLDRVKGFAEWMQIQLSESAEDDGKVYYPFENLFEHGATQGVLKWWEENNKKLTLSIGNRVGTLQAFDEYFQHDYVKMAIPFCLSLGTDLQHQPLSSRPANNVFGLEEVPALGMTWDFCIILFQYKLILRPFFFILLFFRSLCLLS
jgi:hypothetical protein